MREGISIRHLNAVFVEGAIIVAWEKENGELVEEGELVAIVETRKATAEIRAHVKGILTHSYEEGGRMGIGDPIGYIETEFTSPSQVRNKLMK